VAFIDFFERVAPKDQSRPGPFTQLLSAHPGIQSRIRAAQKQMERDFAPRLQYLVQTSEFEAVKARLTAIQKGSHVPWPSRRSVEYDVRPILRRSN
jgi:predicted Zn-dependent protease